MFGGNRRIFRTYSKFRFQFILMLALSFMSEMAFSQLNLTLTPTSGPIETTVNFDGTQIIYLQMKVVDADYNNEVNLYINEQGPISLFGNDRSDNDTLTTINFNPNNTQDGYFRNGSNVLRFEHYEDPNNAGRNDGIILQSVRIISELGTKKYGDFEVDVDAPISDARKKALDIYKRLVGVSTPIDNPILVAMERQIAAGNQLGAAQIATEEAGFYNLVVRDFAARMSTREETINEPFNDFIATMIGVVRDDIDARLLLTGNFFYKGSDDAAVPSDMSADLLTSNNHYSELAGDNNPGKDVYDFASVLTRETNQYLRDRNGAVSVNYDAAGVLTSRAFMGAHAIDGTNRRLVEYTFKQFTCYELDEWADATASDIYVGRDIDRAPGGETSKYLTTCKACHSVMDGFRGAFAKYDFDQNYVKHASVHAGGGMGLRDGVSDKYSNNRDTYPAGYRTTNESWVNNARSPANVQRFGWRGVTSSGAGVKQLGKAIANSRAFSTCMVKRVYRELCRRPVANFEAGMVEQMADSFEGGGYNLRSLFEQMVVRPECLGVN